MQLKLITLLTAGLFIAGSIKADPVSDTIKLSLPAAEKIFLQKNLSLLAAKYNIDASQALIQQAELWDNPVLNTDQNLYDGKFFRHNGDYGQVYVQVMQLVRTAGKRSKLAQLATDNTILAKQQFDDVMRSLRYTLRNDLLEINHQLKIKRVYETEITELQHLIAGMDAELKAGNIALKDNIRLKALLFGLQNELVNVQSAILPVESEIKLLLQSNDSSFILPVFTYKLGELTTVGMPSADSLLQSALLNRPDARMAQTALDFQKHNLIYQKALAKPDISIGTEFDQRNSYAPNYFGLAVSLPLNIFNRNQGNIRSAEFSIKQQETLTSLELNRLRNEVDAAVDKFRYLQQVNNLQQLEFSNKYDELFQNMVNSYRARQISLLELVDFIDTYKDTKLKLVEQHNNLVRAVEDLNYATNSTIIPIQ